ncbi:hypothetical protein JHK82_018449 [Glycine max]|nr:hypothetical protein JHK86_018474 [Glycine max]KAG5106454.1 hypothetical protein JHK82_043424 [Glycine max]KAG5142754.1 hypothetical protein JHK82_018449 [Glycine max]
MESNFFFKTNMLTLNHTLQHELVVPLVGTDWSWMMEFLKGMVKPVAATAVVCLAVALSFYQKQGLELEMVVSIARAYDHNPLAKSVPNDFKRKSSSNSVCRGPISGENQLVIKLEPEGCALEISNGTGL